MSTRRSIERYVEPEITEARLARQWAGTEQRMAKMRQAWWRLPALGVAVLASVALVVLLVHARRPDRIAEGALLESTGPQAVTLHDGSRVDLAPDSRLHVNALESKRVELALERGSAVFDVRSRPWTTLRRRGGSIRHRRRRDALRRGSPRDGHDHRERRTGGSTDRGAGLVRAGAISLCGRALVYERGDGSYGAVERRGGAGAPSVGGAGCRHSGTERTSRGNACACAPLAARLPKSRSGIGATCAARWAATRCRDGLRSAPAGLP